MKNQNEGTGSKAASTKAPAQNPPRTKAKAPKDAPATRGKSKQESKNAQRATREGSKTSQVLALLRRPQGATTAELQKATGWQPHSLRGFLSGTLRKKMGLIVTSTKEDGERRYSVEA